MGLPCGPISDTSPILKARYFRQLRQTVEIYTSIQVVISSSRATHMGSRSVLPGCLNCLKKIDCSPRRLLVSGVNGSSFRQAVKPAKYDEGTLSRNFDSYNRAHTATCCIMIYLVGPNSSSCQFIMLVLSLFRELTDPNNAFDPHNTWTTTDSYLKF